MISNKNIKKEIENKFSLATELLLQNKLIEVYEICEKLELLIANESENKMNSSEKLLYSQKLSELKRKLNVVMIAQIKQNK